MKELKKWQEIFIKSLAIIFMFFVVGYLLVQIFPVEEPDTLKIEDAEMGDILTSDGSLTLTDDGILLKLSEPSPIVIFVNPAGKTVGTLNYGGDEFIFEGDAEESAQIFFDYFLKNMIDEYLGWKKLDDLLEKKEIKKWQKK